MRILLASDNYLPNRDGIATSVVSLATGLGQRGHDVAVLAPRVSAMPPVDHRLHLVPSLPTGYGDCRASWITPRSVAHLAKSFRPELVHVHTLGPVGLAAAAYCRRRELPCVFTWHTDLLAYRGAYPLLDLAIPVCYAASASGREQLRRLPDAVRAAAIAVVAGRERSLTDQWMLARVLSSFDHLVTPSHKAASLMPGPPTRQQVHVIPSAAAPARPLDPSAWRSLTTLREDIACGRPIAFVGRLSPEKNLETLLRVMAGQVLPACPDARLVVVGEGSRRRRYEQLAVSLGVAHSVVFVGSVPRDMVPHVLSACAVLAQPSLTETQGLVVSEAALAGTPSVLLDPELKDVIHDGHTGYVAESERSFGDHLTRLITDRSLRDRLGSDAKRRASMYTPETFASHVESVYHLALVGASDPSWRSTTSTPFHARHCDVDIPQRDPEEQRWAVDVRRDGHVSACHDLSSPIRQTPGTSLPSHSTERCGSPIKTEP